METKNKSQNLTNMCSSVNKQCMGKAKPWKFNCKTVENTICLFYLDLWTQNTYENDIHIKI